VATLAGVGIGLIAAVALLPWRVGVVRGASMTPTFEPGDLFVYARTPAPERTLHRGDVVVLRHNGETWIKRIYATGGDRFWAYFEDDGDALYHYPIPASELARFRFLARRIQAGKLCRARVMLMTIPPGQLFVMGDSEISEDSRTLGPMAADDVVGRVVAAPGRQVERDPSQLEFSWLTPQAQRPGKPAASGRIL
jgi:signal peptidase I